MKKIIPIIFIAFFCVTSAWSICLAPGSSIDEMSFEKNQANNLDINVWITVDNVPAYNCYKKQIKILKKLSMRSRYRVVANNFGQSYQKKKWSLLVSGDGAKVNKNNVIGWVSHNFLLFQQNPLVNKDTNIFEKVLIKEGDCKGGNALTIFNDPLKTKTDEVIEVRTVFFVYDYYPHSASGPENADTLLISPLTSLGVYTEQEPLLIGWIDRSKVTFWNSNTAFEMPVGSILDLKNSKGKQLFRSQEIKAPLPYNSLRNPILSENGNYYKVGIFSRLPRKDLKIRQSITQISMGMEVLFVIDGTRSMTIPFKETLMGVKKVVKRIETQSRKNSLEQPRFAILFYRDHATQSPVMLNEHLRNIPADQHDYCNQETRLYQMGSLQRFMDVLDDQVACDSDNSHAESVYVGLFNALNNCKFLKGKDDKPLRLRVLIHIGDAGNNYRKKITSKQIATLIKQYDIFKYIAIDVSKNKILPSFEKSVKAIIHQLDGLGSFISRPKNLATAVALQLGRFHNAAERLDDQIKIISRGFAGTTQGRIGVVSPEILEYARKIIQANNIDLSNYNAFHNYIEGYIPKRKKIKKYLLVSQTELEKVTTFLTNLIETSDMQNRSKAWNGFLRMILGFEDCVGLDGKVLSISDCNRKRQGLPIKVGFMKYTRDKFLNLGFKEIKKVVCEARMARERFRAFVSDKKIKKIFLSDSDNCQYDITYTNDLNDDGLIIQNKIVSRANTDSIEYIREANAEDLYDKYFFREGGESVAWIPLIHFNDDIR